VEPVARPIDWSPEGVAERHAWYQSYVWPGDTILPDPFAADIADDQSDEAPVEEEVSDGG
jgi:hypothetical protein